ncbi:hypothetical protein NB607_15240 [Vibrio alginolyticus]|uniref:hypothetical protein n=1 Tax=Vibrio alginolyticus TaxID=663 RepID=UPI00215D2526|nr:hypothetical protein [Vibrio alginolyticus]MCS0038323.1 hypothetical protein [Vibrio alginolyticus]
MNLNKAVLTSLIAVSAPIFAADTATYVIELGHTEVQEVGVQLTDADGNPIQATQQVALTKGPGFDGDSLKAADLLDKALLKSNDPTQDYEVVRTLSPLTFDGVATVPNLSSNKLTIANADCDETFTQLNSTVFDNGSPQLTTTLSAGNARLCSTSVDFEFSDVLTVGEYASTLTFEISPAL